MSWPEFHHEAMATTYRVVVAHASREYARQAAAAAFRELDRLESELSRYVESSDIARANRLAAGDSLTLGDDAMQCLLVAAEIAAATERTFDPAYASVPQPGSDPQAPLYTLDPAAHRLTSHAARLHLDLGAIGKGYALDRLADTLREWEIASALLESGGSTALALEAPPGETGWAVGLGDDAARRVLSLQQAALSGSGTAVKGDHLVDPRAGAPASRGGRVWSWAETGAVADALSTAFFVMSDSAVAQFCAAHPEIGAAVSRADGTIAAFGRLR